MGCPGLPSFRCLLACAARRRHLLLLITLQHPTPPLVPPIIHSHPSPSLPSPPLPPASPLPPPLPLWTAHVQVYDGEWVDGRINGFGGLTYADGDKYVGNWIDGKMNGQGTYVYADGDKVRACVPASGPGSAVASSHGPAGPNE